MCEDNGKLGDFLKGFNIWKDEHRAMAKEQQKFNEDINLLVTDHESSLYGHGPNKDGGINKEVSGFRKLWSKVARLEVVFTIQGLLWAVVVFYLARIAG